MTTVDEVSDKTKVADEFIPVVFCLIVLLPNSMSKLIHNRCKLTCKASCLSYTAAYVCANEHLGHCFYVLVFYSLLFSFVSGIIRQYSPCLRLIIVKYNYKPHTYLNKLLT